MGERWSDMNVTLGEISFSGLKDAIARAWQSGAINDDLLRLVGALLLLAAAFALRRPAGRLIVSQIRRLLHRRHGSAGPFLVAIEPPLRLLPPALAIFLAAEFLTTNDRLRLLGSNLTRSLVAAALFWALYRLAAPTARALVGHSPGAAGVIVDWGIRAGRVLAAALGLAAVLEIWGIHVGSMLAGLGLFGAAVALGAQDVFKNMIAGMFIIGEKRFQNGDWIKADGVVEGTVEMIGLRTTRVRQFDSAPVFVPNSALSDNPVINYTQMRSYRISWVIGLTYETTNAQLQQIRDGILAHLTGNADYLQPPDASIFVRVDSFGASSINLMLYCFTATTDWGTSLKTTEDLAFFIRTLVSDVGSGFAFPSQSVYVESLPAGTEIFPASAAQEKPAAG
ncbi:MAG: mechanosensitive ion channel family protein [Rhodobacteraceae bacterium]|nr:mechanosensitive ion channel family protein [Paracoccaceae bacterium]